MSCYLQLYSTLNDIVNLRDFLFPGLKDTTLPTSSKPENVKAGTEEPADGWEDDWEDWNEEAAGETEEKDKEVSNNEEHKWLQDCLISISPSADLFALANENRLVLMTPKYNAEKRLDDDAIHFNTIWSGTLSQESGEFITAVLCLPLASQKRSTQGAPDWTCVVVGFSSGFIRMYTESGTLLLAQKLHTEPVQKLKCNTYVPPRYLGIAEQHEELLILYLRALVTIDGFSLFQALKACRNQVARATASGENSLQPPPLAYKKWAPQEMESIVDCHSTGVHTPNPYDQMVLASLTSFTATIRTAPPAASMYLLSGIGPYLGFFYAIEGSAQPILSEVAYAVASKLKSAIISAASGWLSFGGRGKTEPNGERQPKIEPATPLPLRFGLPDQRREGLCVSLSPNCTYAATTDSFGRVILIDMDRGIAVRMWKGYRDAEVGWVEVKEEESQPSRQTKQSRIAQFLVIYAARRGILEVWMVGNGPRVAAFNVSRYCKLVHVSHGILGLNNVTSKGVRIKAFQVALMEPDGQVKTVQVPFHLALSDKNNKRVRDMHLLKKMKQALKASTEESDSLDAQLKDLLLNIKISSIAQQGVEKVLSTDYLSPKFMTGILKACIRKIEALGEDNLDIERRLFKQYCHLQERLIQTYTDINQLQGDHSNPADTMTISRLLGLTEAEVEHMSTVINRYSHVTSGGHVAKSRVRFDADCVTHVSNFLSCFTCRPHISETEGSQPGISAIEINKDLSDDKRLQLGQFVYDRCLQHQCSAVDLGAMLRKSGIPSEGLGTLLLSLWLSSNTRTLENVQALFNILRIITHNIDKNKVVVDKAAEAPWWRMVREMCSQSKHCHSAYLAAVTSHALTKELLGCRLKSGDSDASLASGHLLSAKDPDADTVSCASDGSPVLEAESSLVQESGEGSSSAVDEENVPQDVELWQTLVQQLDDLSCIECLLRLQPNEYRKVTHGEEISVSVAQLLEGGKGCVTEVVARHVARAGLKPQDMYRAPVDETQPQDSMETEDGEPGTSSITIWDQMQCLRQKFPHSLENDVLFSNSCWEYTVLWNKQPEEVALLHSALDYLKLIQNAMLRQGVASMMWHMFLTKKFQATTQLMDKVGKVPKDRLCRKEIGISEGSLPLFVGHIVDFLNILMEANCETNEVPVFNLEPLWNKVKGTVSLVELAVDQKMTNYGLLKLHRQLALLMHAILIFNIKSIKILSLFDSKGKHAFFKELYEHPLLPSPTVDSTIAILRKQFLTRVISQSVMKMREEFSPVPNEEPASPSASVTRLKFTNAGRWPELILGVGEEFGLDIDYLKRHHVCELYSAGFDKLAEEVLLTVNDHDSLGSQLLAICGQRVAYRFSKLEGPVVVDILSNVNPALSTWLKSMNHKLLIHPDVSTADIQSLVAMTTSQLPESHSEHNIAISLTELVQLL